MADTTGKTLPPYCPFETKLSVLDNMVSTFVPQRLDAELMPTMSGGMRSNVLSGLRSLGLIDQGNHPTPALESLVDARKAGGDKWTKALSSLIKDNYAWALEG